ncbi:hypothetical protein B0H65DRAFT_437443, partial [Neurospora tetraspora]
FLTSLKNEEDLHHNLIRKATIPFTNEDYVLFKTYNKKRVKKIYRESNSSVQIILINEGIRDILNKLPTLP